MPAVHSGGEACEVRGRPSRHRSCIRRLRPAVLRDVGAKVRDDLLAHAVGDVQCAHAVLQLQGVRAVVPGARNNGLRDLFYAKATRDEGIAPLLF